MDISHVEIRGNMLSFQLREVHIIRLLTIEISPAYQKWHCCTLSPGFWKEKERFENVNSLSRDI